MDILKKLPQDISISIFRFMRQPYLDNIDLHDIVLQKHCVGCNKRIRTHLPGIDAKGIAFQCQGCNRLLCRKCIFDGIPNTQETTTQTCKHIGIKMI